MKKVIILGASGSLAEYVTDKLITEKNLELTLFLRHKRNLAKAAHSGELVVEADVLDYPALQKAIAGRDIVYVNLAGDLDAMAKNIVKAMKETGVRRIIAISSIGIYDTPLRSVLVPYRKLADVIESSGLDYTILRPTWFSDTNEVDYEITRKGESEKGSVVSRKSIADLVAKIVIEPDLYINENLGINKPGA